MTGELKGALFVGAMFMAMNIGVMLFGCYLEWSDKRKVNEEIPNNIC